MSGEWVGISSWHWVRNRRMEMVLLSVKEDKYRGSLCMNGRVGGRKVCMYACVREMGSCEKYAGGWAERSWRYHSWFTCFLRYLA